MRNVHERLPFLPIDGASAAPDIATAAGSVKSRWRRAPNACSKARVSRPPTSGPPIDSALKVKLVTPRPAGVAPGSEMFAAAQTTSVGPLAQAVSDSGTWRSKSRSTAMPSVRSWTIAARRRSDGSFWGRTRFRANAVFKRRL